MTDNSSVNTKRKHFSVSLQRFVRKFMAGADDPNSPDEQGRTLLMHASFQIKRPVVRELIERGADIARVDNYGNTALHHAFLGQPNEPKSWMCAMHLVDNRIDINAVNYEGSTALHLCMAHLIKEGLSGYPMFIEFMVEHGANLLLANNEGRTPVSMILAHPTLFNDYLVDLARSMSDESLLKAQTALATGRKSTLRL